MIRAPDDGAKVTRLFCLRLILIQRQVGAHGENNRPKMRRSEFRGPAPSAHHTTEFLVFKSKKSVGGNYLLLAQTGGQLKAYTSKSLTRKLSGSFISSTVKEDSKNSLPATPGGSAHGGSAPVKAALGHLRPSVEGQGTPAGREPMDSAQHIEAWLNTAAGSKLSQP